MIKLEIYVYFVKKTFQYFRKNLVAPLLFRGKVVYSPETRIKFRRAHLNQAHKAIDFRLELDAILTFISMRRKLKAVN